ncbi:hypothetical protein K227x_42070 [Rubripirellula lacrimiformis]|uniref:Alpha/beta hydrolase family protein n=1 Tax=Rubripirellula lacrimiformis TaxID=1930273 RepID=A0A517NF87_9BACT|nr:hypothetical protein [Rubripirellula lacrimiformis]QDT05802.1 hypothetical protein K227x_42070 [Rubripirellula lacrimiformis]
MRPCRYESGFRCGVVTLMVMWCGGGKVHAQTAGESPSRDVVLRLIETSSGPPSPGRRVAVTMDKYAGTDVHHMVYLPPTLVAQQFDAGQKIPVVVEYTGNEYPATGSTGLVEDAGLGFGISGGRFIWVTLPFVSGDGQTNAVRWWGDVQATVQYAKDCIPEVCETYGGDPDRVFLCGFSRGAIGVNFIGLHDDQIADLWCGLITHDHYDGLREWRGTDWGSPLDQYREQATARLARRGSLPLLVCQNGGTDAIRQYLQSRTAISTVRFLDIDVGKILGPLPNEIAVAGHTDRWLMVPSTARDQVWSWIEQVSRLPASPDRPQASERNAQ